MCRCRKSCSREAPPQGTESLTLQPSRGGSLALRATDASELQGPIVFFPAVTTCSSSPDCCHLQHWSDYKPTTKSVLLLYGKSSAPFLVLVSFQPSQQMDPTRGRPRTADDVALSRLTPSSSRRQISPGEDSSIRPDQFPSLSNSPSLLSASNFPTDGPSDLYRTSLRNSSSSRLPSIRLRRNSNASIASTSTVQDGIGDEIQSNLRHARPRSTSQPGNLLNSDRRVPQIGLPRLTEEGVRPTMEEIDAAAASNARLSPTPSVPETDSRQAHSSIDIASTSSPPRRRRALSRIFWPSTASEDDQLGINRAVQAQEAEYEGQLVDLLDTVG